MNRIALGLALVTSCASCAPAASAPPSPASTAPVVSAQATAEPQPVARPLRYLVTSTDHADELRVVVELPDAMAAATWETDPGMTRFVRDVRAGDHEASASAGGWSVATCAPRASGRPCRLEYRVLLREAATALDDRDRAAPEPSGGILSPPSAWMLRPREIAAPFRLEVRTAPGTSFISGFARAPEDTHLFAGTTDKLDDTPYAAFGAFTPWRRSLKGGDLDVAFFPDRPTAPMRAWVDGAAGAIADYFGRFPIEHAALLVRIDPGHGVNGGRTMGHGGGAVIVAAGEQTDTRGFLKDWMLVHELVHVSFPDVSTPWAEEGIATYLEPIIRVRAGLCDDDELWRSLVEGLPQGQPGEGDRGLDVTDTWGRRYWGGALFWFLADVEIRERTDNRKGLDDVLRAVSREGGNVSVRWDLEKVLAMGDAVTGVDVLVPLRKRLGRAPGRADLDALWKKLGVARAGHRMIYDDKAPLAGVRLAIVSGVSSPKK